MHPRPLARLAFLLPAACTAGASGPAASTTPPPAPAGDAAEVPTSAEYGDPLDPSAVPAGRGWHCYSTAPSLHCVRAAADCDADRAAVLAEAAAAAGEEADVYIECMALAEVVASTARDIRSGQVTLMFWTNAETCC